MDDDGVPFAGPRMARLVHCRFCRGWTLHVEPPGPSGICYAWCERCGRDDEVPWTGGAVRLEDFLRWEFLPQDWLVEGLIQARDAVLVHAFRGVGKSRFVHGLAVALAAGEPFLRYTCPEPRGVLLVDGELPQEDLQAMLAAQVGDEPERLEAPFKILAADLFHEPFPSLAQRSGQDLVEAQLEDVSLLILDDVSTLCRGRGPGKDARSWELVQSWLLELHRRGLAVLLVHHDERGADHRGAWTRAAKLPRVVELTRPADDAPAAGAQFEVHLRKARGMYVRETGPFEAEYRTDENGWAVWTWKPLEMA